MYRFKVIWVYTPLVWALSYFMRNLDGTKVNNMEHGPKYHEWKPRKREAEKVVKDGMAIDWSGQVILKSG